MQFRRQICNRALMRVRNLSNSAKRSLEKNTVNSWRLGYSSQGRPGGVLEYQYTRKKIDKIPQNTPNSSKYTQK